jgi:SNW domain-containing protein 1
MEGPSLAPKFKSVPPYLKRKGYVPRKPEDFGDGGAFPEIHVAQYPLEMGRPKKGGGTSTAVVAVDVDADGEVKYDAIVKQGTNRDRTVYTSLKDMKAKEGDSEALRMPSSEEEEAAAAKTRAALEGIIGAKVAASKPFTLPQAAHSKEAKFIQYNPNPNAPGVDKKNAKSRIIRMVEEQVDPLEPATHANKKVPRGPPEDPTPILHSPQRKTTVEDQQAWKIPPCISNWKNVGGFTIPLDKRLAADGRGLQDQTINNNFATLSESLYIAERKAREELTTRAKISSKLKAKEKDQKEEELRNMAAKARMARAGIQDMTTAETRQSRNPEPEEPANNMSSSGARRADNRPAWMVEAEKAGDRSQNDDKDGDGGRGRRDSGSGRPRRDITPEEDDDDAGRRHGKRGHDDDRNEEDEEAKAAIAQRERLRFEKRREREREMRLDNMKGEFKRSKHERERERDVSEKIALGLATGAPKLTGDQQFDSRLFNQSEGMSSGFGAEDDYNVYSKPLFDRGEAASVYRPKRDDSMAVDGDDQFKKLSDTSKFKPDKGFRGADTSDSVSRDGPVQFQKDNEN